MTLRARYRAFVAGFAAEYHRLYDDAPPISSVLAGLGSCVGVLALVILLSVYGR